jgi:hypothetical protein
MLVFVKKYYTNKMLSITDIVLFRFEEELDQFESVPEKLQFLEKYVDEWDKLEEYSSNVINDLCSKQVLETKVVEYTLRNLLEQSVQYADVMQWLEDMQNMLTPE